MRIYIKKLDNLGDLPMPIYATLQSAGLDLMAALNDEELVTIKPMERALINTGIAIALPEGYEAQIRACSKAWCYCTKYTRNYRCRLSW